MKVKFSNTFLPGLQFYGDFCVCLFSIFILLLWLDTTRGHRVPLNVRLAHSISTLPIFVGFFRLNVALSTSEIDFHISLTSCL